MLKVFCQNTMDGNIFNSGSKYMSGVYGMYHYQQNQYFNTHDGNVGNAWYFHCYMKMQLCVNTIDLCGLYSTIYNIIA